MIELNPVKIEAYDGDEHVFTLTMFDEYTAELEIKTVIGLSNMDEILNGIRTGIGMMGLKS